MITGEENSCYPNSSLPGDLFVPVHNFLCTCTMLVLMKPKFSEFYSSLTHRAGNFLNPIVFVRSDYSQTERHTLHSKCCVATFPFPVWQNCRLFSNIRFSLTYKWGFNVGQENVWRISLYLTYATFAKLYVT